MMYENIDFNSIDLTQEPPVSETGASVLFYRQMQTVCKGSRRNLQDIP